MKKMSIALAVGMSAALFAGENLLRNGGFESIRKTPKASSKYLMGQIQKGWDFGPGPVAKVPSDWSPAAGILRFTASVRQPFGGCLYYEIVRDSPP